MRIITLLIAVFLVSFNTANGATPNSGDPIHISCQQLAEIPDACHIIAESAEMLSPTYEKFKKTEGEKRLRDLGYEAAYIKAKFGLFGDTTDVFLVGKAQSNRVFVVITGSESKRDWYENAKISYYATKWRDGYYYTPPGHAGFRSGALNVIGRVLKHNEFDINESEAKQSPSKLSKFVADNSISDGTGNKIRIVVSGHSRGAGIAILLGPAFDGLEIKRQEKDGPAKVGYQDNWPYKLEAIIGFATPQSIYTRKDSAAGLNPPTGARDHWAIYADEKIAERMISIDNERDIVPLLSIGLSSQVGHRFSIGREKGVIKYAGFNSPNDVALWQAHGQGGYCQDVLEALKKPQRAEDRCDCRSYSQMNSGRSSDPTKTVCEQPETAN